MSTDARQRRSPRSPGAQCLGGDHVRFSVWAPRCRQVAVRVFGGANQEPAPMADAGEGWFEATVDGLRHGTRYMYLLDGVRERPDPAGRALPEGVHGPSEVVDTTDFIWSDANWGGLPLKDMVLYEIHMGTFTPEGTFDGVIPRLSALRDLGITAIELMPVASFPGVRNWGYDGVGLFAPQRTYGGPAGLQRLVDACHAHGLAVVLDVVYNHLGPEGNYLAEFGPYFTERYSTPWGPAINFDGDGSRSVRDFVIANALSWIREYHIDGLRLDAIHGIFDSSPVHILRELNEAVQAAAQEVGRVVPVMAESDLNERRVIDPVVRGGYGLAGQWHDDFHHCLHTLLTGERNGYYADFGSLDQLAKAYTDGFVYDGIPSGYRGRHHGTATKDIPGEQFLVFSQNHDQVGNRAWGERLAVLTDFEGQKLAAAAVLLSPFVPLLFMGEEYGEPAPFLFFADFGDPGLREAVSRGRREEFAAFGWQGEVPDPHHPATFCRSKLSWALQDREPHRWLRDYYRTMLALRKRNAALGAKGKERLTARVLGERTLAVHRRNSADGDVVILLRFASEPGSVSLRLASGRWRRMVDSAETRFGGLGPSSHPEILLTVAGGVEIELAGHNAVVYRRENRKSEE